MSRKIWLIALPALVLATTAFAADRGSAVARGKQIFLADGCWACHGTTGHGSFSGLKLAPDPLPVDAMIAFIRGSTGPMPAYSEALISDAEIADVHAYLQTMPKSASPDSIPALKDLKP